MESKLFVHEFRFIAAAFAAGALLVVLMVLGSLVHGELARAWVAEIRRAVKRD